MLGYRPLPSPGPEAAGFLVGNAAHVNWSKGVGQMNVTSFRTCGGRPSPLPARGRDGRFRVRVVTSGRAVVRGDSPVAWQTSACGSATGSGRRQPRPELAATGTRVTGSSVRRAPPASGPSSSSAGLSSTGCTRGRRRRRQRCAAHRRARAPGRAPTTCTAGRAAGRA